MKSTGERVLVILGLLLLVPACGVGGSGGTLTPTVAPGSPSQVKAVSGNGRVTLTWTSAGVGETIVVARGVTAGGPYFPISVPSGFVASDTYVDTGLDNDVKYYYVVTASNPFGQSVPSSEVGGEPSFKPISVVTGPAAWHTLTMFEDGTVWAWGSNGGGALATGEFGQADAPVQVAAPAGTIAVGAGANFSLFLLKDGTVSGVGGAFDGQLGLPLNSQSVLTPVSIPGVSDIVAISAGGFHVLALQSDGTVWAWGNNTYGQVGNGLYAMGGVATPYQIPSLSGVVAVSAGYYFSLALLDNGTVWAWGQNVYGNCATGESTNYNPLPTQVPNLNGVTRISGGGNHALALRNDGTVWGWGDASLGQVGHGITTFSVTSPVPVSILTGVTSISAGRNISLALKSDGTVWSWGSNGTTGMLGNGAVSGIVNAPARITSLSGIKAVATGGFHSVAVRDDGSLFTWGENAQGQLGVGATGLSLTPVVVNNFTSGVAIAAGDLHSHVIRTGGIVWSWGGNQSGVFANGVTSAVTTSIPVPSTTVLSATAIAAGENHGVAILAGSVRTWGSNQNGQIGNGAVSAVAVVAPHTVALPGTFTGVDAGWSHTLAMRNDGIVFAWGNNQAGQIGTGGAVSASVNSPSQVVVLDKAVAISGGGFHNLALRTDPQTAIVGAVWSWGANSAGQLGYGPVGGLSSTPSAIPGLVNFTAVAAGGFHSLALKDDGTVWAWGNNTYGQVGNGAQGGNVPTPVQLAGLSGVVAIAAGEVHSLALLSDGTVRAWGRNDFGQLGDGTNTTHSTPVPVPGLTGITQITCGNNHNVAADNAGLLWGWGNNSSEQVGKTFVKFSAVPVGISH